MMFSPLKLLLRFTRDWIKVGNCFGKLINVHMDSRQWWIAHNIGDSDVFSAFYEQARWTVKQNVHIIPFYAVS